MTAPSADAPRLTGVVLAGGRSTRMGIDKALLRVDGETLLDRSVRRLGELCPSVLVASGDGQRLPCAGAAQIADAVADVGPLGGILAGLECATTDLVAVVAVDLPYARPAVLALLAGLWRGEPAVVPVADGRLQPLHAVYASAAAAPLRRLLRAGRSSLRLALTDLGARVVPPAEWAAADPSGGFARNLNRPEDLAGLP